jgi:hypothetical protein
MSNQTDDKKTLIKASLLFCLALVIALFLVVQAFDTIKIMSTSNNAMAMVIDTYEDIRETSDGRQAAVVTIAIYEFSYKGRTYNGKTEGAAGFLDAGDKIIISFNPNNPTKNRAKGDREVLGNFFIFLMFGGALTYYLMKTNLPILKDYLKSLSKI